MKKDTLAKAVRLADKSTVRPETVVISKPSIAKKPMPEIMSERVYARLTPREMKRLKSCIGSMFPISELIRDLLTQYLDNKDRQHDRKTK